MEKTNLTFFIPLSVTLNSGDAAILLSTINSIKQEFGEDTKVVVASAQFDIVRTIYPTIIFMTFKKKWKHKFFKKGRTKIPRNYLVLISQLLFKKIPYFLLTDYEVQILENIKVADVVLFPGGGYLTDSYHIQFILSLLIYTRNLGKDVYLYAQSFGPFWRKTTIKLLRKILPVAKIILTRDEESISNIVDLLGFKPANCISSIDEAFLFNEINFSDRKESKMIGISVREWDFSNINKSYTKSINNYISNIKNICEFLVEEYNYNITFISTCQGYKEYRDDSKLAKKIYKRVNNKFKKNITINTQFNRPDELMLLFEDFDLFIGTRMHAIMLNLLNLTPCLGIIYEFKTRDLFKRLKLAEYTFEMYSGDYESFKNKVEQLIKNKNNIKKILLAEIPKCQNLANQNIKYISRSMFREENGI